eukprot:Gregarina_sp_Poly_1__3183@NODE_1902_length_3119_cov_180_097969_g1190_i2_p7_GENE_NODE_1902_length_3119_cov_180_097969_g1190_i2NODE_1902_length_3119_cov_180_097969_g1190_i2_p7_ORF_typecomplete_len103_score0_28_NODE_1902_length_3119_cov_180_097969_g1190_i211131421
MKVAVCKTISVTNSLVLLCFGRLGSSESAHMLLYHICTQNLIIRNTQGDSRLGRAFSSRTAFSRSATIRVYKPPFVVLTLNLVITLFACRFSRILTTAGSKL